MDERPSYEKELRYFRTLGKNELVVKIILNFGNFMIALESGHVDISLPPPLKEIISSDEIYRLNNIKRNERREEAISYSQTKHCGEV